MEVLAAGNLIHTDNASYYLGRESEAKRNLGA